MRKDRSPRAMIPEFICKHGTPHSRRDLEMAMQLLSKYPEKFPDGVCIYKVLNAAIV